MADEEIKIQAPPVELVETPGSQPDNAAQHEINTNDSLVGQVIAGHYKILSVIGEGGLGIVYRAEHELLGTKFAIKFLSTSSNFDQKAQMRFQREAQATVDLRHPLIASTKEFGIHNSAPYLVMEFVEGRSLAAVIEADGKLDPERAFALYEQAAEALAFAHQHKVVHRDIKPANIIVQKTADGKEEIKLIDFGIAKVLENDTRNLTQTGEVFGTPSYMSPEQIQGLPADYRSDIYSLGCVAYEMFSGAPPFSGERPLEVMMKHLNDKPQNIKDLNKYKRINRVIDASLAKDPGHRYQSCNELITDLGLIGEGRDPVGKPRVANRKKGMQKLLIAGISMLLLLIVLYSWFLFAFGGGTIESYTEAIARDPKNVGNYYERSRLYENAGRLREAISDLSKAIEVDPKYFWAYKRRSEAYSNLGEYDKALADANKAIEIWPNEYRGYLARGTALIGLGRNQEALVDIDKSLDLNHEQTPLRMWSNRSLSYYYRGKAHNNLSDFGAAQQDLTNALMSEPGKHSQTRSATEYFRVRMHTERARARIGLGLGQAAAMDLMSAEKIDPSDEELKSLGAEVRRLNSPAK